MFKGSITALVTPFKNDAVDWDAFDNLIEWQIAQGTHGLVLCGTTAESPVLTNDEYTRIVERGLAVVKKRVPVIIGTGTNATATTIEKTIHAKNAGADAALVVTPYYNKPTQEGLYAHYYNVVQKADMPTIIYNIPGRSVVDMDNETMARLAKLPQIIGVKDATGDLSRPRAIAAMIDKEFCQLSGEDGTIKEYMQQGGVGCISVASNVAPAQCAAFHNAWMENDFETASKIDAQLAPLHAALFYESSPAPAKYALSKLGLCSDELRLPLLSASTPCRALIDDVMKKVGLISDTESPILRAYG
jgi:4-hydroxy-tetrahydrodipicolinate synthase